MSSSGAPGMSWTMKPPAAFTAPVRAHEHAQADGGGYLLALDHVLGEVLGDFAGDELHVEPT